ncbi:MAG: HU family DNA-binding protein [Gammaproteobacteria bacterium]|nr:HU family DNA-binding protein [Gammaproteobacteria bacterium]
MAAKKKAGKKKASAKKATAKKAVSKKASAKKATSKKVAATKTVKAAPVKMETGPVKEKMTKSQMYAQIADETGMSRKDVSGVLDAYSNIINRHIKRNSVGLFVMPGMFKVKVITKPARKARKGVNPFTGEEMMFKAKPATKVVKILPLKAMKEIVK